MTDIQALMSQATAAFQKGEFGRARDLAHTVAHSHPRNVQVLQFLGIAQIQAGNPHEGFATLKRALDQQPDNRQLRFNTARAALDAGRPELVAGLCAPLGNDPQILQLVAQAAKAQGKAENAIATLERLVAADPANAQLLNNLGNAQLDAGQSDQAIASLQKACALAPTEPQLWLNLGRALSSVKVFDKALEALLTAVQLNPVDPDVNVELGKSLLRYGRHDLALLRLSEAARGGRQEAQVLVMIGLCFAGLERREEAEQAYRTALHVDPTHVGAILNLALQLERENRLEEIETLVAEARKRGLDGEELAYCDALLLRRSGDLEGALALIEANSPDGLDSHVRSQMIGQIADRLGDFDKAYHAFADMNAAMGLNPEALRYDGTEHGALVRQATATLTPEWRSRWIEMELPDERPSPAFLGGFLRSGTTLLDTILMGHGGTDVREEQPMLARLEDAGRSIEHMPAPSAATLQAMRDAYFKELAVHGPVVPGKLVIDKYPLMTLRSAFIHRAFPDAKFIFALRHPCDVVLSCFMQNFRVTSAMASFLTLENAARFYDAAMSHWIRAREMLPLDVHTVRYEDMVLDLEGQLRPLLAFLGLEWDASLLDYQKTAKDRGYIRTPSYAQVTEKLYTRSSGRWEAYRQYIEPILPTLEPWIEAFGYDI